LSCGDVRCVSSASDWVSALSESNQVRFSVLVVANSGISVSGLDERSLWYYWETSSTSVFNKSNVVFSASSQCCGPRSLSFSCTVLEVVSLVVDVVSFAGGFGERFSIEKAAARGNDFEGGGYFSGRVTVSFVVVFYNPLFLSDAGCDETS
jgi:hypothetical protein